MSNLEGIPYDERLDRLTQTAFDVLEGETQDEFNENNLRYLAQISGINIIELQKKTSDEIIKISEQNR